MKKLFGFLLVAGMISTAFVSKPEVRSPKMVVKEGIDFKSKTFEDALKEAQKSGKLIFIDAYTEWCGPCKKMAATSFMEPEVATLFNAKFINLKIEMEKSADGPMIAQKYSVRAYPSLLFINGDGKVVKYAVGYQTAEQLVALGKSL
jgi:thioredoxin 1